MPRVVGQGGGLVAAWPELGEDEQLNAARRGQVDHVERDLLVPLGPTGCGQPLRYPNLEVALHRDTWLAVTKAFPVMLCFQRRTGPFMAGFSSVNALLHRPDPVVAGACSIPLVPAGSPLRQCDVEDPARHVPRCRAINVTRS